MNKNLGFFSFIVLTSVAFFVPASPDGSIITTARYVSVSQGNDANDGTAPDKAWKTLTKVSQQPFGPGATIYLKRGEVWKDALLPKGHGDSEKKRWITVKPYGANNLPKPAIDRKGAKAD